MLRAHGIDDAARLNRDRYWRPSPAPRSLRHPLRERSVSDDDAACGFAAGYRGNVHDPDSTVGTTANVIRYILRYIQILASVIAATWTVARSDRQWGSVRRYDQLRHVARLLVFALVVNGAALNAGERLRGGDGGGAFTSAKLLIPNIMPVLLMVARSEPFAMHPRVRRHLELTKPEP